MIIDFFSRFLDRLPDDEWKLVREEVELIIGQLVFGLITNSIFHQYGRLVEYFVQKDTSAWTDPLVKLKYVDEIFEECHRNMNYLDSVLSIYRGYDIEVEDVVYDRAANNVSFRITHRVFGYNGRRSDLQGIHGERCAHGRPLLRRR